jgi:signal transduction histidine kinase/ActR/RegA family two-component response regulator
MAMTPDHPHDLLPATLAARIHQELLRIALSRALAPLVAGIPFACLIVWILWPSFSHAALLSWLGAKVVVTATRIAQTLLYSRGGQATVSPLVEGVFMTLLIIDGLVWGSALIIFPSPAQTGPSAILFACMVGVSAVGTLTLSSWYRASASFASALLLPAALWHVVSGNAQETFAGLSLLFFLGLMLLDGRRAANTVHELLRMRFEHARLASDRADALALAERHSEVKSRFLATMSHEMRTPLHGMLGTLQLLHGRVGGEERERLALIERSGEHLLSIINDVLDFSKIEAGKMPLESAPFDLEKALRDVADLCAQSALQKNVTVSLELDLATPAWVLGDVARLRQVVMNLVGNAVKFTPRGAVGIRVSRSGAQLEIAVRDSGIGIAPDQVARIFDAFSQAEDGYSRRFSGTGLGLTISRQLARAMGGELVCDSTPGHGSTFTLTLPWRPAPAPDTQPEAAPPAASRIEIDGHVLLVDDNPVNLMVAEAMLETLGVSVVVATNGAEAVDAFRHARPALVLMDCHMPVMDGYAATARIRALEAAAATRRTPVIAVTANAFDDDRQRCLAAGMDDHLGKPFRADALREVMERHLRRLQPA